MLNKDSLVTGKNVFKSCGILSLIMNGCFLGKNFSLDHTWNLKFYVGKGIWYVRSLLYKI